MGRDRSQDDRRVQTERAQISQRLLLLHHLLQKAQVIALDDYWVTRGRTDQLLADDDDNS
jgi:hypothetical protein